MAGKKAKASDLFIECLEKEGVEYVFGVPGEENLDFLDSLSRSKQIKLILTRHEQGAGFMACGYARASGRPGVCVLITGPGVTNAATALGQAYADSLPAAKPLELWGSAQVRHGQGGGRPAQAAASGQSEPWTGTIRTPD